MSGSTFEKFALRVARGHDQRPGTHLMDEGPEEQGKRMAEQMTHFARTTPLMPVIGTVIDLAGFGEAPAHFQHGDTRYLLLSEVADALGWPLPKADAWARLQHSYAVKDQREVDEERGDGRLGYDLMRDYLDLRLDAIVDDPEAKPDANGQRWSHIGEWLVSSVRLPLLLSCSPWGREFYENTKDHFGHVMRRLLGDELKNVATYGPDGPTGGNAYDDMFRTDLTEEEALRKAHRGPALDGDGGQP